MNTISLFIYFITPNINKGDTYHAPISILLQKHWMYTVHCTVYTNYVFLLNYLKLHHHCHMTMTMMMIMILMTSTQVHIRLGVSPSFPFAVRSLKRLLCRWLALLFHWEMIDNNLIIKTMVPVVMVNWWKLSGDITGQWEYSLDPFKTIRSHSWANADWYLSNTFRRPKTIGNELLIAVFSFMNVIFVRSV